jgi:hypothetical protein
MGSTTTRRFYEFTIPRKWAWELIETDEAQFYQRIGNVSRFNPPSETTPRWEDMDRDWADDMGETDQW